MGAIKSIRGLKRVNNYFEPGYCDIQLNLFSKTSNKHFHSIKGCSIRKLLSCTAVEKEYKITKPCQVIDKNAHVGTILNILLYPFLVQAGRICMLRPRFRWKLKRRVNPGFVFRRLDLASCLSGRSLWVMSTRFHDWDWNRVHICFSIEWRRNLMLRGLGSQKVWPHDVFEAQNWSLGCPPLEVFVQQSLILFLLFRD
jgi:hypothetical protein